MMSASASARASAMALPMPRRAPVTRAVFPSSLNRSRMFTGLLLGARYEDLHHGAAAFHLMQRVLHTLERAGGGDDAVERHLAPGGQTNGGIEVLRFVDACAGQLQLAPEEAEQIDLGLLREDRYHHDAA